MSERSDSQGAQSCSACNTSMGGCICPEVCQGISDWMAGRRGVTLHNHEHGRSVAKPEPDAWLRKDGWKAMPAYEKDAWIEAGRPELVEDYTIPLYLSPPPALSEKERA